MKKVFISSTCFDLPDARAEIPKALKEWGYEPVYNESANFPKKPGLHSHDVCIEAVKECDYYLLIIDERYGGKYSGKLLKNIGDESITWCEAETAYAEEMPVFTFVRKNAWTERETYRHNRKKGNKIEPTFVDDPRVFDFIDHIVCKGNDNWIEQFENSVQIKEKLQPWLKQADEQKKANRIVSKLYYITEPAPHFTGRKDYLDTITKWYSDAKVKVGCLEGFGGMGKSSIARRWYDDMVANGISPEGIFWWGFYKDRSLDNFLDTLLKFTSDGRELVGETKGSWRKKELIVENIAGRELLIVLDGFEEMQKGEDAGENFGCCKHGEVRELLRSLCYGRMKGLCLITTRYTLKDVVTWEKEKDFASKKVKHLSKVDGRKLLESYGVTGEEKEIEKLSKEYDGHALSLTLLATLQVKRYGGKVEEAGKIPSLTFSDKADGKARRILIWYDKQLSEEERVTLRIHSLFRREVTEDDFPVFTDNYSYNKLLQKMDDFDFRIMLDDLLERRLLSGNIASGLDAHPLVREYFEDTFDEEEKRACHEAIYHHIGKTAPEKPKTLEEMAPLFAMVRHGCEAGLYDKVLDEVYGAKIDRDAFLTNNLGAWETDLNLVRHFFPKGDLNNIPLVTNRPAQAYLINEAALTLQVTGCPQEAISLYREAVSQYSDTTINYFDNSSYAFASRVYQNLSDLQYRCGDLEGALESAGNALNEVGKVENEIEKKKMLSYSNVYLAWCRFLAGEGEEAGRQFREANKFELEVAPARGGLCSLPGVLYTECLLREGKMGEAHSLVNRNLEICSRSGWIDDISRCRRIFGEIERVEGNYGKAAEHLDEALAIALEVGMPELEIEVLLARGRLFNDRGDGPKAVKDAELVLTLVERTTFYLYEPDAFNILARAALLEEDKEAARGHAEKAKEKAEKMGYALAKEDAEEILGEI